MCLCIYIIYDICQIVRYALEKTIQYTMSKPIATSSDLELAPHEKQLTRYFWGRVPFDIIPEANKHSCYNQARGVCATCAFSRLAVFCRSGSSSSCNSASRVNPSFPLEDTGGNNRNWNWLLNKNDVSINTEWKQLEDPSFWSKKNGVLLNQTFLRLQPLTNVAAYQKSWKVTQKWQRCEDGVSSNL